MARPKDIGTVAETAVVKYLRTHGWPSAGRRTLGGAHDLGDITGTPGVCWEIKSGKTAERASDGLIVDWLDETETERRNAGSDIGVLVTKRAGYGPDRAASWWAHLDLVTWYSLTHARRPLQVDILSQPIRMHLSTLLPILHTAGYGTPTSTEAVA